MATQPLAETLRPRTFDGMVGQAGVVGPSGILRHLAETRTARSMILYGPPGCGKSTAALIYAAALDRPLHRLNAVDASVADIKGIAARDEDSVVYLDEVQYFNKRQQQSLLPYTESGRITLVAATTENPYHAVYDALLSRCLVLEFKRPTAAEIERFLERATHDGSCVAFGIPDDVCRLIAGVASGDVRRAVNDLELAASLGKDNADVTAEDLIRVKPSASMAGFDMDGDSHYGYVSALQKSIRGSDPDAAVFWLSKLMAAGDILSPCRRLPVVAAEDIGLANPFALVLTMACCEAAETLGMPEAAKPLTECAIYLALSPKSASVEPAYQAAFEDISSGRGATVPPHLAHANAPDYVWPQDRPCHFWPQQYLPDDLVGRRYYVPGDNDAEQRPYAWWDSVRRWYGGRSA